MTLTFSAAAVQLHCVIHMRIYIYIPYSHKNLTVFKFDGLASNLVYLILAEFKFDGYSSKL